MNGSLTSKLSVSCRTGRHLGKEGLRETDTDLMVISKGKDVRGAMRRVFYMCAKSFFRARGGGYGNLPLR